MNVVWAALVVGSVVVALFSGSIGELSGAMLQSAKTAVDLVWSLLGGIALWLGVMRIAQQAGLVEKIARALTPLIVRLFPAIPRGHPAIGAMVMNLSANFLGMDNAATPFGLKTMTELDKLNGEKGVATNAMVLFLAINTAGISALPVNVVAARAALNPKTAAAIVAPTFIVTLLSMLSAVLWVKLIQRMPYFSVSEPKTERATGPVAPLSTSEPQTTGQQPDDVIVPAWQRGVYVALSLALFVGLGFALRREMLSGSTLGEALKLATGWLLPLLAVGIVLHGLSRGVKVYEAAVSGAKEGFDIALRILPYIVIVLMAVGLFRASGLMTVLTQVLSPVTDLVGMPAAVLPQAVVRPMSGSAAMAVMVDVLKTYGPDSREGFISSVIYGSSETTFYVLAVYFGVVGVKRMRHAVVCCLLADLTGVLLAVLVGGWFFGR